MCVVDLDLRWDFEAKNFNGGQPFLPFDDANFLSKGFHSKFRQIGNGLQYPKSPQLSWIFKGHIDPLNFLRSYQFLPLPRKDTANDIMIRLHPEWKRRIRRESNLETHCNFLFVSDEIKAKRRRRRLETNWISREGRLRYWQTIDFHLDLFLRFILLKLWYTSTKLLKSRVKFFDFSVPNLQIYFFLLIERILLVCIGREWNYADQCRQLKFLQRLRRRFQRMLRRKQVRNSEK